MSSAMRFVVGEQLHDGLDARILLRQIAKLILVTNDLRVGEQPGEFFEAIADGLEFEANGLFHRRMTSLLVDTEQGSRRTR